MILTDATPAQKAALMALLTDEAFPAIYACDAQTREMVYVNQRAAYICGKTMEQAKGQTCYSYLKGLSAPCDQCYLDTSTMEYHTREYTSAQTGRHYLCGGRLVDWNGRRLLVEYVTNETERLKDQHIQRDLLNGIPVGAGIYDFYMDGRILHRYLNDGYYHMLDAKREDRGDFTGFGALGALHPDDVDRLKAEGMASVLENRTADVDIRVLDGKGVYRWLKLRAKVASKSAEKVSFYVTYSDVDRSKKMQLQLEASQRVVQIANKEGKISIWLYNMDQHLITQDLMTESAIGYPRTIPNVPESQIESGAVHPNSAAAYRKLYEELHKGAETCEATVRIRSGKSDQLEWQHVVYTRLHDAYYGDKMAIGVATNVELQQELQQRFSHEQQLRMGLIRDSVIYYQLNLTTGIIEEYNAVFMDITGMKISAPVNERLRENILSQVAENDREAVRNTLFTEALKKAYAQGQTTASLIYRRKLGTERLRWIKTTANIMKHPSTGEIIAFLYCQDVDRDKKNRLAVACIMDEEIESVIVLCVESGQARFVRVREEYIAAPVQSDFDFDSHMCQMLETEVLTEDRPECRRFFHTKHLMSQLQKTPIVKCTYRTKNQQDKVLRKKTRAFFLDETKEEIILIRRDITDLYQEEQRQKRVLQETVRAATEANQAKSSFLSRISHDMRTPLTAILALSGSEMLQDATPAQKDEYLEKIHASGEYLRGLINDVLDMSRIENKKMVLQTAPYALEDFRETIETVIGEQCRQKGIDFVFHIEDGGLPWILVDKVRFNQLFVNLLSNAVKFTPVGGCVEFHISCIEKTGSRATSRYVIRDNGIGMASEFLPHAFDSFAQERRGNVDENAQGTGLGLAIVKQIVDMMGGTIQLESQLGKGTTFTVELAYESADERSEIVQFELRKDALEGLHILLCEDNTLNQRIVSTLLQKKGCTVECADNGQLGFERFQASAPYSFDLILMDIRMPIMNGLEATQAIRSLSRADAAEVPIVALTADAFNRDMQSSFSVGMNGHLSKPIEPQLLYETIALHTGEARR